jgi:hypothetical protein
MQSDIDQAAELDRLRAQVREMEIVITALLLRDGRLRIRRQEIEAASQTPCRVAARNDETAALILELHRPAKAPAQRAVPTEPAVVVPTLTRAH